jgi:chemotaxis protein CheD
MNLPPDAVEVFLGPGDFRFCERPTRLRTVLGSCVAMTFWHPEAQLGAMSHCMLPRRVRRGAALDGKYIDEAFALFQQQVQRRHGQPGEFQLKLFGGGEMFPGKRQDLPGSAVARSNVEAAREQAAQLRMQPIAVDVGGAGHRNIFFDTWSGDVWVRYTSLYKGRG